MERKRGKERGDGKKVQYEREREKRK